MGAAGTVLLKNVNGTLPLIKPRSLVLVGSDGGPAKKGPNGYPDRTGLDGLYFPRQASSAHECFGRYHGAGMGKWVR